ncbi:MAG: hypothetical protein DME30_04870 [Verrucomicrobia bacterium]|nr:MAG: hypothetical protein DME30_04870 [Verrucomicrobiota bacterium]
MPEPTDKETATSKARSGYRISNGPVVRFARSDPKLPNDLPEVVELPRVYGAPLLFAIARDPRTLFAYWNVDWSSIFENTAPVDRQVHLRVYRSDGSEETVAAVEPMVGNSYLTVSEPRESYRVEIGYYHPAAVWNSVATSDDVKMPPERAAENVDVDVATIPFHLTPRFSRSRKWRGSAPTRRSVAWIWRKQQFARFRRQQLELAVGGQRPSLIPSGISGGGALIRLWLFP